MKYNNTCIEWPNKDEYLSLRTEMISRISSINTMASSAFSTVVAAWAIAGTLLVLLFNENIADTLIIKCLYLMQLTCLLIPCILLLPIAIKSGENLCQIVAISCYIRVFYEHYSENQKCIYAWESANNSISNVNIKRRFLSFGNLYNSEFAFLSVSSFGLQLVCGLVGYGRLSSIGGYSNRIKLSAILILLIGLILTGLTAYAASVQLNMQKRGKKYTAGFVMYGAKRGIFPEDRVDDLIDEILQESNFIDAPLRYWLKSH